MMHITDITGLISIVILLAALVRYLSRSVTAYPNLSSEEGEPLRRGSQNIMFFMIFVILFLSWKTTSILILLRGITGDLSITTQLFLLKFLVSAQPSPTSCEQDVNIKNNYLIIAFSAMLLYPFALGIGDIDPYRLGYGHTYFLIFLALNSTIAHYKNLSLIAWSILLAVAAWTIGWYESTNLWDYLLDHWITIYALWKPLSLKMKSIHQKSQQMIFRRI